MSLVPHALSISAILGLEIARGIRTLLFDTCRESEIRSPKMCLKVIVQRIKENGYVKSAFKRSSVHIRYIWRTVILEVSKAISDEALDVLYGQNIFVVSLNAGSYHDLLKFGVANLRHIRYHHIEARPMGAFYGKPMVFDPQL